MNELERLQDSPHYNPMGAIGCHGNQSTSTNLILPKTKCSQAPTQMMLLVKFGPRREKTYVRGLCQSEIQTSLLSYRDCLEN